MNASVTSEKPKALSESQKNALINLLADEDPAVYRVIREKFLSYGQMASAWM